MNINIYADDSEFHCSGKSVDEIETLAQEDMNRLQSWLSANRLKVNVSKSASMLIGSKCKYGNKELYITLCGNKLPFVNNVKYLGVHIDRFLKCMLCYPLQNIF